MTQPSPAPRREQSLRSQTARGVAWMMALKLAVRSLSMVSTLILVRLLSPEDFGLVAMAMIFIAIMDVISWFSFDLVLIQRQSASRDDYDTAWTFNVLFKTVSSALLLLLAQPAAAYYAEPRVATLIMVLAGAQFISGFGNIGIVNFRKMMRFDREFLYIFLCKFSGFIVTIPLAFILRNYWALIVGQVVSKLVAVGASFVMEPYRPRFSLAARHELFSFSKWLVLGNVFRALSMRLTELIIGKVSGPRDLGLFNISLELSNTPTTELIAPINRAVFPAYAKIAGDMSSLRRGYLSVIAVITLVALPAGLGISASAQLLVPVALGDQWLPAIPLFMVLGINGALGALHSNMGSVFLALGRPKVLAFLQGVQLLVLFVAVIPATIKFGISGAALGFLGSTILMTPVGFAIIFRAIELRMVDFMREVWRPFVGAGVMYVSVRLLVDWLLERANGIATFVDLVLACSAGVIVYVTVVAGLWCASGRPESAESFLLDAVRSRLQARSKARKSLPY